MFQVQQEPSTTHSFVSKQISPDWSRRICIKIKRIQSPHSCRGEWKPLMVAVDLSAEAPRKWSLSVLRAASWKAQRSGRNMFDNPTVFLFAGGYVLRCHCVHPDSVRQLGRLIKAGAGADQLPAIEFYCLLICPCTRFIACTKEEGSLLFIWRQTDVYCLL